MCRFGFLLCWGQKVLLQKWLKQPLALWNLEGAKQDLLVTLSSAPHLILSTMGITFFLCFVCLFASFFSHCYFSLHLSPRFLLFDLNVCFPFLLRLFPSIPFPPPHPSSFLFVIFSPAFTFPYSIRQMSAVTAAHTSFISWISLSLSLSLSRFQILRDYPCILVYT